MNSENTVFRFDSKAFWGQVCILGLCGWVVAGGILSILYLLGGGENPVFLLAPWIISFVVIITLLLNRMHIWQNASITVSNGLIYLVREEHSIDGIETRSETLCYTISQIVSCRRVFFGLEITGQIIGTKQTITGARERTTPFRKDKIIIPLYFENAKGLVAELENITHQSANPCP